jgi:hypothetical protein
MHDNAQACHKPATMHKHGIFCVCVCVCEEGGFKKKNRPVSFLLGFLKLFMAKFSLFYWIRGIIIENTQ